MRQYLHAAVVEQILADDDVDEWYAFRHPLTAEAIRTRLTASERRDLSRRAADAIRVVYPEPAAGWRHPAALLLFDAGETRPAAELLARSGRAALAAGAVTTAIELMERSQQLLMASGSCP